MNIDLENVEFQKIETIDGLTWVNFKCSYKGVEMTGKISTSEMSQLILKEKDEKRGFLGKTGIYYDDPKE